MSANSSARGGGGVKALADASAKNASFFYVLPKSENTFMFLYFNNNNLKSSFNHMQNKFLFKASLSYLLIKKIYSYHHKIINNFTIKKFVKAKFSRNNFC